MAAKQQQPDPDAPPNLNRLRIEDPETGEKVPAAVDEPTHIQTAKGRVPIKEAPAGTVPEPAPVPGAPPEE